MTSFSTSAPATKVEEIDGETQTLTLVCRFDEEDNTWGWEYRSYNIPGTCYPDPT